MNAQQFIDSLNELDDSDFQAILDGQALIVFQDSSLTIGRTDVAYVIFELGDESFDTTDALKASLIERAEDLITEYYQYNPLSKEYFNKELTKMMQELGWDAFLAMPGQEAKYKLFVDGSTLHAEDESSPRYKYGSHQVLDEKMPATAIQNKAKNWIQSGAAYENYISTNVCRWSSWEE